MKQHLGKQVCLWTIDENHQGQRVDNFLLSLLKGVPKTHVYRIIRKGEVRVNKGRVKQVYRLQLGDVVRIPPLRLATSQAVPKDATKYQFLESCVLFEDDALLVLNKPSGMAVHAGSGIQTGVIEALRAIRPKEPFLELVHRLDRETSGCLVLAKKASALKTLQSDFRSNSAKNSRLDKRYLALVKGSWKHGDRRINKPLNTDHRRSGERHVIVDQNGVYASSKVTPVSVAALASLIEVKLLTGRTHQVRVHCQAENHPLAGDQKYGDDEFNKLAKSKGCKRLFLHAKSLGFYHPVSAEQMNVTAPLPTDLLQVVHKFGLNIP